jgi:hypothetical protein
VITGYGEQLKPFLVETLTSLGATVHEGPVPKTPQASWETPEIGVEMLPDTYDDQNWTTCHARLTATLECADKKLAIERSNNLLAFIARRIQLNVEWGLPKVLGNKPPWLPGAKITAMRPATASTDFTNIALVWECDFPTALGGLR